MPLYPLVLALLIGAAAADEARGGIFGGAFRNIIEPRLGANAINIHRMEKHIGEVHKRIEEAQHADPHKFAEDLKARLDHIEGNHCAKHEFQCGSNDQECVSDLFVCDGHKDCHNGHDEDAHTCDTGPVRAGNVFNGITHWVDCLPLDDHSTVVKITGTRRFKFFTARVGVRAEVTSHYKDEEGHDRTLTVNFHGGYNFANRRLSLIPIHHPGKFRGGITCTFWHGDNERMDCKLVQEGSLHVCADSHLSLEHNGHHHHEDHHEDGHGVQHTHHDHHEHPGDHDDPHIYVEHH